MSTSQKYTKSFVPKTIPRVRIPPEQHGLVKRYALIQQLTIPEAMREIIIFFFDSQNGSSDNGHDDVVIQDLKDRVDRLEKQLAMLL